MQASDRGGRRYGRAERRAFASGVATIAFAVATLLPLGASAAAGDRDRVAREQLGSDQFVAGGSVRIDQPLDGDLVAFGGHVAVEAPVGGDVVVAGGTVKIDGSVGQSIYVAGGEVAIGGPVGRNVRAAGGRLDIGRDAAIRGSVTIGGGEVEIDGAIAGYLQVGGGHVRIDAPVGGDVVATAGHLELGPHARIGGRLRYASRAEADIDGAAQVAQGIEQFEVGSSAGVAHEGVARDEHQFRWAWAVGFMLLAAALVAAWPDFSARVGRTLRERFGGCLLAGLVALVAIPIAALILLATVIGIPMSLLAAAGYIALLFVGYVTTAIALGDWALSRLRADALASLGWRVAAAAAAMLAIRLLGWIPYFGVLVLLVVLLAGIGALLLQVRRASSGSPATP